MMEPGGSNPRPNSIGGAEWQGAQRKRHQSEAESDRNQGCNRRPKPGEAVGIFQAQCPSDLKQASAKKCDPCAHGVLGPGIARRSF
jgi:hypothetical protein